MIRGDSRVSSNSVLRLDTTTHACLPLTVFPPSARAPLPPSSPRPAPQHLPGLKRLCERQFTVWVWYLPFPGRDRQMEPIAVAWPGMCWLIVTHRSPPLIC